MNVTQITEYIVSRFSSSDHEWLDDCILEALRELYDFDELTALEQERKIKEGVKDRIKSHISDCERRGIPPRIKLLNDEVLGKQRSESMEALQVAIRSMDPYEFQRLCCVFVKDAMGYSVISVKRHDKGADITAKQDIYIVAQARRHIEKNVSKGELEQWVLKVKQNYPGAAFVFLTATSYSNSARMYADQMFVRLKDGEQIAYFLFNKDVSPSDVRNWLDNLCQNCHTSECELKSA